MKALRSIIAGGLLTATALVAAPAHSALSVGTIPEGSEVNDFIDLFVGGSPVEGWYGAQLYLVGGPADITIEIFGAEAGFRNTFWFGGNQLFAHPTGNTFVDNGGNGLGSEDALFTTTINGVAPGLLDFCFGINSTTCSLFNGSNPDNSGPTPNFFATFDTSYVFDTLVDGITRAGGTSVFLFLDDAGAGNDDNHDDLVVRLTVRGGEIQVPEPGTLALLGLGLVGFGLARRRRVA